MQGANLERELKVRVMDRPEVILDIFSTRARSHEAKLQVELAQLEYLLPRLTRMWTHLSRIRGGIGLRGPGETQLETDRRIIRQPDPGAQGQAQGRRAAPREPPRRPRPDARAWPWWATPTPASRASCARSRASTRSSSRTGCSPRSTRSPARWTWARASAPGSPTRSGSSASCRTTWSRASAPRWRRPARADLLLHVVDASHPDWEGQMRVVERVLAELDLADRPMLLVFNKMDAGGRPGWLRRAGAGALSRRAHASAPCAPDGLASLKARLRELERAGRPTVRVRVPVADGARLAALYRDGEVLAREEDGASARGDGAAGSLAGGAAARRGCGRGGRGGGWGSGTESGVGGRAGGRGCHPEERQRRGIFLNGPDDRRAAPSLRSG